MFVSVSLIFYGSIALYMGVNYGAHENNDKIERNCLTMYGILVFLWCFGYGMMGLCKDIDLCYFWRSVGLLGIIFYLANNFIYIRHFTGLLKNRIIYYPILVFNFLFAIVTYYFVIQRNVVSFFEYEGRMAYSSQPCLGRTMEGLYLAYIVCFSIALGIIMLVKAKFKRTKKAIFLLICSHFFIVLLMIPDTIFPILGKVSIPTTGFGAFISFLCFMYVVDKLSTFNLSRNAINEYIFKNIDSSIMFFDLDGKLLTANNHAKAYLNIKDDKNIVFTDLFDLSRDDVTKIIAGNYKTEEGIGIAVKGTDKRISAAVSRIYDKYSDPIYYSCVINDITSEAKKFEETNYIKEQLDKEVKAKTREIEMLSLQTIETMANTLEAKDEYTKGHSSRVSEYSVMLARELGLSDEEVENIRIMSLLHDVGKIAVPDRVLNKAGRLEDAEFEVIKSHTTQGYLLLKGISCLGPIAQVARHHHERFDGRGYPDKLSGENIEFEARIVGIADSYDAMSSDRVYRKALPKNVIREELIKGRGTQFDPNLLDVFLKMFDEGKLDREDREIVGEETVFNMNEVLNSIGNEGEHNGASVLSHEELVKVYNYLKESNTRYGSDFTVVLVTLACDDPEKYNPSHIEKAMIALEYSVTQCLRKTDLASKVSLSQMMIILTEADEGYLSMIMERIFNGYYKNCLYTEIKPKYEVS